jgi:hypothetical protein
MALVKSHIFTTIRGVTGDLEFRLRKNRKTDLSKKRFPSNPRTDAQQAVRKCYGKGVQAYNQLTPAELDYWNEIGKGYSPPLDAYRAFMKDYIPTCLAPSEQTEEQTQHDESYTIYAVIRPAVGQRLTIANRQLTKLGFWLTKQGSPTADITFRIRRVSDNGLIAEKVWGNAADLPETETYEEVTLDTPVTINEEVRISPWYEAGDGNNCVRVSSKGADVKANEVHTSYLSEEWSDDGSRDCTYRYKYYEA